MKTPLAKKTKLQSQLSAKEVVMIRTAVNLQLNTLHLSLREAMAKDKRDENEVEFYKSRIEEWVPFAAKINEPFDRVTLANALQNGGWNGDEDQEDVDDYEEDGS